MAIAVASVPDGGEIVTVDGEFASVVLKQTFIAKLACGAWGLPKVQGVSFLYGLTEQSVRVVIAVFRLA
ncbi:MAG: hypothetical protein FJW96_12180 [Actinobacteria bacterium]|nr:hypothetical protein [Actinomycetota bacterium]